MTRTWIPVFAIKASNPSAAPLLEGTQVRIKEAYPKVADIGDFTELNSSEVKDDLFALTLLHTCLP